MKNLGVVFLVLITGLSAQSCKKKGCTLEYAKNYDSSAEKDDQTCEFYTRVHVTDIKVTDFPDLDANGALWDAGSLPDLYVRYTNHEDDIIFQTTLISEIEPQDTLAWTLPSIATVDTSFIGVQFKVYEVDGSSAELIEKLPVDYKKHLHESKTADEKYPDSLILNGTDVNMIVYLNWVD